MLYQFPQEGRVWADRQKSDSYRLDFDELHIFLTKDDARYLLSRLQYLFAKYEYKSHPKGGANHCTTKPSLPDGSSKADFVLAGKFLRSMTEEDVGFCKNLFPPTMY